MMNVQDRRADPRVSFDTELWIGQEGVYTRSIARLADVSVGGARIVTSEAYQVGSVLSLRFALGKNFVTTSAIVRYNRPGSGIGVQFLDISSSDKETLQSFISAGEQQQ